MVQADTICLGIDLGTTMTVVWAYTANGPEIVLNRRTGGRQTPSRVYFDPQTGKPHVGGKPNKIFDQNEVQRTVDNTKRFIGRYWYDPVVVDLASHLNYVLVQDSEHRPMIRMQVSG